MKRRVVISGLILVLASCAPAEYSAEKMATDLKDNVYKTSAKIKEWAMTPPRGEGPPQAVAASYCYYVMQDIICYRQPMPGWEYRLAGYQGTGAEPPVPSMMQPLPVHVMDKSHLPENRVATAAPVFDKPPAEVDETQKPADQAAPTAATADVSHEQLPDPALAPQL